MTPGAIGMLRGTVEQPQGCAHTATHTFCVQKCPLGPLKSLQHSQQLQAWTSAALDEVQELVTVPQLCCGRCISFHVPALSHSFFFSVYICSDLRSKWWEGTGSWSACVLRAGSVDKKCVKEVSYPPTHNQGRDLISCFVFFFFSFSPELAIVMKHFCTGLISLSPPLCLCLYVARSLQCLFCCREVQRFLGRMSKDKSGLWWELKDYSKALFTKEKDQLLFLEFV